tara:strand:- start:4672 stop:5403 length:732 start_codon:yes stop_codon:yes gene_type:complete
MVLPIKSKDNFIRSFLNPVSRLDTSATLLVDNIISAVVHNNSNIFLRAEYKINWEDHPQDYILCLPDTIKLIKILSCLEKDEINLTIDDNCITYKDDNNRFKYHLFDDSLKSKNAFDFAKINNINFGTSFDLTREKNSALLKALPFVTETSKVYLKTEGRTVFAELSDKKIQNIDSYTALIADEFDGDDLNYELILDVELFRLISTLSFDTAKVYINNEYKMLMMKLELNEATLTFVSTSYKN